MTARAGLDVQSFMLQVPGHVLDFRVGRLDDPTVFPASHLKEHQANGQPVKVTFHDEAGTLVATRLEDG